MARNVTIQRVTTTINDDSSNGAFDAGGVFTPTADNAVADIDRVEQFLNAGASVDIRTHDATNTGTQDGDITVVGDISPGTDNIRTLRLNANDDIVFNPGASITQNPGSLGKLNIVLNADSDDSGLGRIHLDGYDYINAVYNLVTLSTNGGDILLGGRDATLTGAVGTAATYATAAASGGDQAVGVLVDFATLDSGGGNIALSGRAVTSGSGGYLRGVIVELGSDVNADGGNVTINGLGGPGLSDNYGVAIGGGATNKVRTIATGSITITGTGGSGDQGVNDGVLIGFSEVSAFNGAITITGIAGSALNSAPSAGVRLSNTTDIVSTGSGAISITGTGANGGDGIAANSFAANFNPGNTIRIGQGSSGPYTGNISLTSLAGTGIALGGLGDVVVSTTGTVGVNAGAGIITLASGSSINGTASVTLTADDMSLVGTTTGGSVTLQTSTAGRAIALGANTAGTLGLTSAELNTVTASGGTLTIGRNDVGNASGNISVVGAIAPTGATTLVLRTGGSITQTAAVTETNLALVAATGVTLTAAGNDAGTLAGSISGAGAAFSYTDADALTVGTAGGIDGIATNGGAVALTAGGSITLAKDISTGVGAVTLTANGTGKILGSDGVSDGRITTTGLVTLSGVAVGALAEPILLDLGGTGTVSVTTTGAGGQGNIGLSDNAATGLKTSQIVTLATDISVQEISIEQTGAGGITVDGNIGNATDRIVLAGTSIAGGAGTVTGGEVWLAGTNGVGTSSLRVNTAAGKLQATSNVGGVFVNEADAVELVGSPFGNIAGDIGAYDLLAGGTITVSNTVNDLAGLATGNTTLRATAGDIVLNAGAGNSVGDTALTSDTGEITRSAGTVKGNHVSLSAATGIGAAAGIDTAASTLAFSNSTSGNVDISNTGALTIGSAGSLTSSSNLGGTTSIDSTGAMTVDSDITSAGDLTLTVADSSPATADIDNITINASKTVSSTAGNVALSAGDILTVDGVVTVDAGIIYLRSGISDNDGASSIALAGALNANVATGSVIIETASASGSTTQTAGAITASGLALRTTSGTHSFTLTQQNAVGTIAADINGALSFTNAAALIVGTVNPDGANTIGINTQDDNVTLTATSIAVNNVINVGNATASLTATTGGLTMSATGAITAAGTILSAAGTGTFSGTIGGGTLTKQGVGTVTLAATNTYSGATTIDAGTLLVDGSIAASSGTTVKTGGTLGGGGTVGAVTVESGGSLAPGSSPAILNTGSVSFTSGANFNVELGGATVGTQYDQLNVTGTVTLGGATLNGSIINAFNPAVGTVFTIINNDGVDAVSGTFAGGANATIGGRAFRVNYAGGDGNDVTVQLGALTISGTDPVNVLADVNVTTVSGLNVTSPTQSNARSQYFANADVIGVVNNGVTVDGFGLDVSTNKTDGSVDFTNNGTIRVDNASANNSAALVLIGNGGGVHYSGSGTITNHATNTPNSAGLFVGSNGGSGGFNLIEVAGSITGGNGVATGDGTTTVVVTGTVVGTSGIALVFGNTSSNNTIDLKTTAVINGLLDGSGNGDTVRLSGASGSGNFDLSKIGGDFSDLVKAEAATWTVTGALNANVATTINNGALLVNGTVGTVLVNDAFGGIPSAELGGTGTVGNVTVQYSGILAPGTTGAGTLTSTGNVTFSFGSIYRVEIGGATAGTQYDVLKLTNTSTAGEISLGGATLDASYINGFSASLGQSFRIIDNAGSDAVDGTFAGLAQGAILTLGATQFAISYVGGDGNDVTLAAVVAAPGIPVLTGLGPTVEVEQAGPSATPQILDNDVTFTLGAGLVNASLTVSGLKPEDTVSVLSLGFDPNEFFIDGSNKLYFEGVEIGTITGGVGAPLVVTFNGSGTERAVDALIENLTFVDASADPAFARTLSVNVTNNGQSTAQPITVKVFNGAIETGTSDDNSFTVASPGAHIDAGAGIDTVTFDFRLVDATVTYKGNQVIIDGPSSHSVLSGFEKYVFTDGTVNNDDGNPLVDDLFYYARNHDVWNAHADADAHYNTNGWHENRDPNAFFDTSFYLLTNADVRAANVNPLTHFDATGWKEGRIPAINFDSGGYLAANPDVKAAGVDPLAHFLANGAQEGRQPIAPTTELLAPNGFDYIYYLQNNPDVAAAGIDPFQHFETVGWKEGRDPNALFDTDGYLAVYGDVKNAGVNPLDHYHTSGWKEGRDPSPNFDTSSYLAAYADVAAAKVDPLVHYLDHGRHEGRSAFADGIWG